METLYRHIQRVARSTATVLVTGESGTGKELVARALHQNSARRDRPFIALNCSALSAELVESELFGHVRGAFTGAVSDHTGLFRAAHTGTLFLDEIGDLALPTQAKVLRALENGEVLSVGSTRPQHIDVRVIAATNKRLEDMVATGLFRDDLLYRLKVVCLSVPPLRERREDIMVLVAHFLDAERQRTGSCRRLDSNAVEMLEEYAWPGNVRELRNALAAATIVAEDNATIAAADLVPNIGQRQARTVPVENPRYTAELPSMRNAIVSNVSEKPAPQFEALSSQSLLLPFAKARENALQEFDRYFLSAALMRNGGNVARTARSLGLHRQSLQKLMLRRGLKSARWMEPAAPL